MNILPVHQGTLEWAAARAIHDTASEASAMMGVSKYQSRTDLLNQKRTGVFAEVGTAKQALFERGHAAEHAARPMAEEICDADLYPITAVIEIDGLNLLASLDGIDMQEADLFEHKLWSESLAASVRAGNLAPHYTVQMDQQLLVSGGRRCLFMTSDGTRENMAWCWYESSQEKFDALIAGWKQFHADLDAHVVPEVVLVPVGRTPDNLPALRIEVTGMVTASNLDAYREHALTVFKSINRELTTDQQFADAEKVVKWCSDIEERIAAAKQHALSQTESIDALFSAMDSISAEARATRLELDRLVKVRKESIRIEIVNEAKAALSTHVVMLNKRLGKPLMPSLPFGVGDFAAAVKGKRSVDSIRDAVNTTLANAKISANAIADRIQVNLTALRAHPEHGFLFSDEASIVLKEPDDLAMLVTSRIAAHAEKEAARLEAERARIRREEEAKAQAAVAESARIAAAEVERKRIADEASAKPVPVAAPPAVVTPVTVAAVVARAPAVVAVQQAAVIQHQDDIAAFVSSRHDWSIPERNRARAVIVEYEKFKAEQRQGVAA